MISCKEKELTIKDGRATSTGDIVVVGGIGGSEGNILDKVSGQNLLIGSSPLGTAPKKKLKARKNCRFSVKVKEGFVLFYIGREFLGLGIAPEGRFRFGIAACDSFIDIKKVELSGKLDPDWMKNELEK